MDNLDEKLFYEAFHLANKINKDKIYKITIPELKSNVKIWDTLFENRKIKISNYIIDIVDGTISKEFIDFNIISVLRNLTLKRTYSSESKKIGLFGYGFISEYEIKKDEFYEKNNFIYTYGSQGNLKSISDKNKNHFEIRYIDSTNLIESIITSCGKKLSFKYKNNKVETITDNIGRIVKYIYDNNFLVEVIQANGGKYRFEYDSNHKKLSKVIDANKKSEIEISYNRYGKTTSILLYKKILWNFEYDERDKSISLIDSSSNSIKFTHNKNNLIKEIDINNKYNIHFKYDEKTNLIFKTAINGAKTQYYYDDSKNITMKQFDDGSYERYFYNANNLLTKLTKSSGYEKILSYDSRYNLIETREKINLGLVVIKKFEHDERGRVIKITDGNKNVIKHTYKTKDSAFPEIIEYSNGFKYYLEYDEVGRLIFENNLGVKTSYKYNNLDLVIQTIYNNGSKDFRRYDKLGNILEITTPREMKISSDLNRSSRNFKYIYDESYNLKEILDPNSKTISINKKDVKEENVEKDHIARYDYIGNVLEKSFSPDDIYIYSYDKNLNIVEEKHNFHTNREISFVNKKFEYDDRNNLTRIHINSGEDKKYLYTGLHRLSKETIRINETKYHKIFYEYNDIGLLREKIELLDLDDADLESIGNIERLAARIITKFEYDENNCLIKITLPNENFLNIKYDDCNNIIYSNENKFLNDLFVTEKQDKKISHLYDKHNRIIKTTYDNGEFELFQYDYANNISSFTDKQGFKTDYKYNSINKLKEMINEKVNKITYFYDLSLNCRIIT